MFSKIGLQFRYYRVLSKALLGFSVPDNQPSMTAHYVIYVLRSYRPCPTVILVAVPPLSFEVSLHGVRCHVAIALAASPGSPSWFLFLDTHLILRTRFALSPVVNPRVRRLFSSSPLARHESSCSCSLLVVIPHVRLLSSSPSSVILWSPRLGSV